MSEGKEGAYRGQKGSVTVTDRNGRAIVQYVIHGPEERAELYERLQQLHSPEHHYYFTDWSKPPPSAKPISIPQQTLFRRFASSKSKAQAKTPTPTAFTTDPAKRLASHRKGGRKSSGRKKAKPELGPGPGEEG
jgi:hypothetical protein